jgi:hypothetical protein
MHIFIVDSILSVCAVPKPHVHVLVCVRRIEERDAQNKARVREQDLISKQVFSSENYIKPSCVCVCVCKCVYQICVHKYMYMYVYYKHCARAHTRIHTHTRAQEAKRTSAAEKS